ncbi:hypothetical protein DL96DRAFT_1797951 [Flagelloscypha sp. PMI_526]|nr:hypothetical protein DL96DRAFT_1797951 [Flagelloscypha sp. PMI_526]
MSSLEARPTKNRGHVDGLGVKESSMTGYTRSCSRRKTTWLALCLIAFATFTSAHDPHPPAAEVVDQIPPEIPRSLPNDVPRNDFDSAKEAHRAYRQAMYTLNNITQDRHHYSFDPSSAFSAYSARSIFAPLIPNPDSQGIISSALRFWAKIQQTSLVRILHSTLTNPAGNVRHAKREQDIRRNSVKVLDLLQFAAELGHEEALYVLAQVSLFPPTDYFPSDPSLAYHSLVDHATHTGNASSQALLAFFHSTGYGGIVPINHALAQLYYTFAANGGHKGAQMALGYRYLSGIGTLESCESALRWYEQASEQAIARFLSGPHGGRTLPLTPTRLSDLVGGPYGYGSSVASTGMNIERPSVKAGLARAAGETWEAVLDFYSFNGNRGAVEYLYRLGKIYYHGSIYTAPGGVASGGEGVGAVPQSYERAMHHFLLVARQAWPRDPPNPLKDKPEETKDDEDPVAQMVGVLDTLGEYRESQNALGIMWRDGLVPNHKADLKLAKQLFNAAATNHLAEATVNLAKLHFEQGEIPFASAVFDTAIRSGSPFEAAYYLGRIQSANVYAAKQPGSSVTGSCGMAVGYHKQVAERGSWEDDLVKEGEIAWVSGTERSKKVAMLKWWIAAERGFEIAQNNLAYVLDQDRSILRLTRFSPITPSNDTASLALIQWTRAASQRNIDALVKVGDYYYHGLGVPPDSEASRYEKAAKYYQSAADTHASALAMWNLGWMYENGVGVPQDFHLAKRNYDLALDANPDAYFPILLSLIKLYARSFWYTLNGGEGGLTLFEFEEEVDELVTSHPHTRKEIDSSSQDEDATFLEDREDESWYMGKAREHLKRKASMASDEGDDPVEWARERRLQERAEEGDFGPEDYFDAALLGGNREPMEDEEFTETMLLVLLCIAVSVLIYVRARIVEQRRQNEQRENRNQ